MAGTRRSRKTNNEIKAKRFRAIYIILIAIIVAAFVALAIVLINDKKEEKPAETTVTTVAAETAETTITSPATTTAPTTTTAGADIKEKAKEISKEYNIVSEDMSRYEIAQRIYVWANKNTDAGLDIVKALLEDNSIKTQTINGLNGHDWLIINIGDGWYHFDSSIKDAYLFMLNDEQLETYSLEHKNSHSFDFAAYSERGGYIINDMKNKPDYNDIFSK